MNIKQALAREPVSLTGLLTGVLLFLLVRFGHMRADAAQQALTGVLPVVGGLIARQFVTPATAKVMAEVRAHAASTVDDVVAVLQRIENALTIDEPAVKVLPAKPVTDVPLPAPTVTSSQNVTAQIPAPPEPWTPPEINVAPILPAPAATESAAAGTDVTGPPAAVQTAPTTPEPAPSA